MIDRKVFAEKRDEHPSHLIQLSRRLVNLQEEEKRRLAAALHDRTSPNLAAIALNLGMIGSEPLSAKQTERLADIRALLDDTIASLRAFAGDLRPPLLDYAGLVPALTAYVRRFAERTGIDARLDCTQFTAFLLPEQETLLFRIVQEALTNCARHAAATSIDVDLIDDENTVILSVHDNGIGFAVDHPEQAGNANGLGLPNMRAMTEIAGGLFFIQSRPGQGTAIRVEI